MWQWESLVLLLFWAGFPKSLGGRASPAWAPGLWGVMLLFLMAACARCRVIKVPDHPEALCFQIRGAAPPYVYAVGRGEWEPDRQTDREALGAGSVCVVGGRDRKPLAVFILFILKAVVFNWGDFHLLEDIWQRRETSLVVTAGIS